MFFFSRDPYRKLKKRIGANKVLDRREDLMVYAIDASFTAPAGNHDPEVVVLAENVQDVIEAVHFAREANMPIVARGKGSGMSAGSVPLCGGMVIVTEKMNRLFQVNANEQWLQCEPGLTTEEIKNAAEKHRLFYPPDPSSYRISSIGGNIAENAGGLRCVKYGTTKDYVLGLKYVDANGELISTGALSETATPFDLTPLLIGSEGLFGIIVEARLALIPQPKATHTLLAHFPSVQHAVSVIHTVLPEIVPSVLEFMDQSVINAIKQRDPFPFPEGTVASLLIETDGDREISRLESDRIREILNEHEAIEVFQAADVNEREHLWELRRLVSPGLSHLASGKMNEDVVIPIGRLGDFIARIEEIAEEYQMMMPIYGHCGDGNLHLNVMYDKTNKEMQQVAHDAIKDCFQVVIEMGGSISGEHGIGASKNRYMDMQFSPDELQVLRNLKVAFDPENRLNPEKVLPPFNN